MRRLTTEEFIAKARKIHGDLYDYSMTEYVKTDENVEIGCLVFDHGIFPMTPSNHTHKTNPQGCPQCGREKAAKSRTVSNEEFKRRVREIHGDEYDLSVTVYNGARKDVSLICRKHGLFTLKAMDITGEKKSGCRLCGIERRGRARRISKEEFLRRAEKVHGNKFDYSEIEYVDLNTKIRIVCQFHGPFDQTPEKHLVSDYGCFDCSYEQRWERRKDRVTTEVFIRRAQKKHGLRFDYSLAEYIHTNTEVEIICPDHGLFSQSPANHLNNRFGCGKCAAAAGFGYIKWTTTEFIEKARLIHGDWYDYSLVDYVNSLTDVKIICPDHGPFEQAPSSHINTESGCTGCAKYGFDMSSPAYIYLLKYTGREGEVLKIGITKHLHVRIKQLENSLKLKGKGAFDTIQLIDSRKFNLGKRAKDLEDYFMALIEHRFKLDDKRERFQGIDELYTSSILKEWNSIFEASVKV